MDSLAEELDSKLRQWKPETAESVRRSVLEIIDLSVSVCKVAGFKYESSTNDLF
jgi:hypothetical protein